MGNFTDLAPELILEVLSHLDFERATLCRLALVSTRFRDLAQQVLLRHLVLQLDVLEKGISSPFDHVVRIFDRDPLLSDLVRTLNITWLVPSPQIQSPLSTFLGRLHWMEYLHISTTRMVDRLPGVEWSFDGLSLPENALPRLRRFRRSGGLISWRAINEFVKLPSLIDVSLQYPPPRFPRLGRDDGRFASLRRLELGNWKGPGYNDPLATLLGRTKALEILHLSMCEEPRPRPALLPSQISQVLSAVRHTLKDLTIDGPRWNERSILDLTEFTSLRRIRAFANLFYNSRRVDRLQDGMHWQLPNSLTELELAFISRRGFILHVPDPALALSNATLLNPGMEEQWITQLALNNPQTFQDFGLFQSQKIYWIKDSKLRVLYSQRDSY